MKEHKRFSHLERLFLPPGSKVFAQKCTITFWVDLYAVLNPKWPDYTVTNYSSLDHNPFSLLSTCLHRSRIVEGDPSSGPSNVRHSSVNIADEKSFFLYFSAHSILVLLFERWSSHGLLNECYFSQSFAASCARQFGHIIHKCQRSACLTLIASARLADESAERVSSVLDD